MVQYWDINKILPYQRNFNFINGERSIGKTYTTLKFVIKRCIDRKEEFVYIVRTQDEKEKGVLEKAVEKVINNEFKENEFYHTVDEMYVKEKDYKRLIGRCIALSEALKIKKRSFPLVKYLIFDEYMLESKSLTRYVSGWKEPELFLSIYHTIDREEDRVVCFLLGNTTTFYNPYHLHPAFHIPQIKKGEIWTSENVLFQWAESSATLANKKEKCKFLRMIQGSDYGTYANDGEYIEDGVEFIEERSQTARHIFNIQYMGKIYGIWNDMENGKIYVDNKYAKCHLNYALTLNDHNENTLLTKSKNNTLLNWLSKNFKIGNVRFTSMEVKKLAEPAILLLL